MAFSDCPSTRYKIVFYVPTSHVEACKTAVFAAGAGQYAEYSEWCFVTIGQGQFRPGASTNPHIGMVGVLEQVEEARVETVCTGADAVRKVVAALKEAHPYEEVPYSVFKREDF